MSDNPKHLFEAAFDCKTAEAFMADVLNKQNPESVKKTLAYLASLVVCSWSARRVVEV